MVCHTIHGIDGGQNVLKVGVAEVSPHLCLRRSNAASHAEGSNRGVEVRLPRLLLQWQTLTESRIIHLQAKAAISACGASQTAGIALLIQHMCWWGSCVPIPRRIVSISLLNLSTAVVC